MSDAEATDRTVVKTYVPRHQKAEWVSHAEDLDMTQSEFVRCMVQAGRAEFEVPDREFGGGSDDPADGATATSEPIAGTQPVESSDSEPAADAIGSVGEAGGGLSDDSADDLAERVLAVLRSEGHCSWDQLVDSLTAGLEDRLDEALGDLQQDNRIKYSGRDGGYTMVGDDGQ